MACNIGKLNPEKKNLKYMYQGDNHVYLALYTALPKMPSTYMQFHPWSMPLRSTPVTQCVTNDDRYWAYVHAASPMPYAPQ
eukprot:8391932-Prorocentrum_lima.AAC.1